MLHKHQSFFVFADFVLSILMVVITVLALNGFFHETVVVNSCPVVSPSPVVEVSPSPVPSVQPSESPSATPKASTASGALKKVIPSPSE